MTAPHPGPADAHHRQAAKVILVDRTGLVLLFRGFDPGDRAAGTWWFAPGGGLDPGESFAAAARREVREETGLLIGEPGPVVHVRHARFDFGGRRIHAEEHYFRVEVDRFEISPDGWTELERQVLLEHRWWSGEELRNTSDVVYPEDLASLIERPRSAQR